MKYARLTAFAIAVVLLGVGFVLTRQAFGQTFPNSNQPVLVEGAATPFESNATQYALGGHQSADPELDKVVAEESRLERETASLVAAYSRADDNQKRDKIKADLSTLLEKQFDAQQKRRDVEVSRIEAQLKKLRDLMRKRSEARQSIVDKRLDQLLRDAEGLGWSSPGSPQATPFYRAKSLQPR
jgi:hypothetical protein